jgi:hypothetical protein
MTRGLSDKSEIKEEIVKSADGKTATRFRVIEEIIDLEGLRREKERLESELNATEPSNEELVEMGRMYHPFYMINKESHQARIDVIKELLK